MDGGEGIELKEKVSDGSSGGNRWRDEKGWSV